MEWLLRVLPFLRKDLFAFGLKFVIGFKGIRLSPEELPSGKEI